MLLGEIEGRGLGFDFPVCTSAGNFILGAVLSSSENALVWDLRSTRSAVVVVQSDRSEG